MMSENEEHPQAKIPISTLIIIFIGLAISLLALGLAVVAYEMPNVQDYAWVLLIFGFIGVSLSTYVLLQTRRRIAKLRIEIPPVVTTIECAKCGYKNVREFLRGDYIFKELDKCQKCDEKMMVTSIYREVKDKDKEPRSQY